MAILVSIGHAISLPMGTTYDGFVYLDLADVLDSARFPSEWHLARTPLFPLALKAVLWLFGRQPNAVIALLTTLGLANVLVIGATVRAMAGPVAAALVIVLIACYPTSIAYQHLVLTESGTALLMASIVAMTVWSRSGGAFLWRRTLALAGTLAVAYYWRQALFSLAALVAGLHVWSAQSSRHRTRGDTVSVLVQAALIVGLPLAAAQPWKPYSDDSGMTAFTIRQGLVRQALLPIDHPLAAPYAERYRQAIADAGNLRSGLRSGAFYPLFADMFGQAPKDGGWTMSLLLHIIRRNPLGYLGAVGRTLLLYGGAGAVESENSRHRTMVLDLRPVVGRFDGVPGDKLERVRSDFGFPARESKLRRVIRALAGPYDWLVALACLVTVGGLAAAVVLRHPQLATLCGAPVFFVIPAALTLASVDRYAFPTYPLALANLVLVPVLVVREISRRRSSGHARSENDRELHERPR